MLLKPLKKLTGLDYLMTKTVLYIEEWISQFSNNKFIQGNEIEITVSTTATAFDHGLSSTPNGWIITDISANVNVWRTDWDERTITLDASGSATVKVWVF